ncbi:T9SS type B sorting domain-containing protein [Flavobacterium sp. 245]|uniref:Ig-like domain-containing protein n=1 Tax=Flavobacterium sp. 245 TaxID=2512115 RepID=UPI00105F808C|nr:T9SS type B sorting domain-containing protein [Flavobacterium sp. 245]TDO97721.1 gliding motility-associated-like protein [Flavobacterium sp. 245]
MKNNSSLNIYILFILLLSTSFGFAQYTPIPDPNFEKALIDLNIDSGAIDGQVLTANIKDITTLLIPGKNITNLTGIEAFVKLETLNLGLFNDNTSQRNFITNLNLSNNIFLKSLSCGYNELSTIDLSKNTALESLHIEHNQLSSLDVSQNSSLTNLSFYNNNITSIDLTKNTSLINLICPFTNLTTLDLSKNITLKFLNCSDCKLSNLDISKNPALEVLDLKNNQITSLDASNNPNLGLLDCSHNQITSLNIANNSNLGILQCNYNQLISLDLSNNTNLNTFSCDNNLLTYLNLKNGQNAKLTSPNFKFNSSLTCIQVDDEAYSNTNWKDKDNTTKYSNDCSKPAATTAPIVKATGDQLYCPQNTIKIVTDFTITHDPAETGTRGVFVQISSGYSSGLDQLALSNPTSHPNVTTSWDSTAGKLSITSSSLTGGDVLYSDLVAAVKDVMFTNPSASASGTRTFSITVGNANYLPSTQHFYLYVPSIGITWTSARTAAEASTYYGLKGYLATILSADEAKLIGEQASGTGWIGGSDQETEGVWKWMTGPEAGTLMTYTFWNNGEPNNLGDEDYAHITQPGVGIQGSWNDLSNTGSLIPGDNYQPKGYVVEYGGSTGESPLEIATSTKITIPEANVLTPNPICDSGSFTINATATAGATISWYTQATGGTAIATGSSYTTPIINITTTYYVDAGCETNRKSITAVINKTPTTPTVASSNVSRCGPGSVTLQASSDVGLINWYTSSTGGTSIFTGNNFNTPTITSSAIYYAEASNNGCLNGTRTPVNITIYTPPVVTDETVVLCQFNKKILDAGISGMTYLWSTGATTQTIEISTAGTYTVDVTSPAPQNCTSRKTIKVEEHEIPQIDRIDVEGTRAIIYLKKEQSYFEYSVDGSNFQDSNIFYDVPGGLQTAYVREKGGCGGTAKNFVVLVFPAFFTPNNDSYNDVWEVTGMENYPQAQVTIFDRYGKLLAQLSLSRMSWDGTFNQSPLPASDYWYALKIDNLHPILRGHFTLKR